MGYTGDKCGGSVGQVVAGGVVMGKVIWERRGGWGV